MKKLVNLIKEVPCSVVCLIGSLLYAVNNVFGTDRTLHVIKWKIDDVIPFNEKWIIPYWYWYIFIAIAAIAILVKDKRLCNKTFYVIFTSSLCNNLFYLFYQTTVPRPIIEGDNFFSKLVLIAYNNDNPINCFPSTHVSVTVVLCIFLYIAYKRNIWVQLFNVVSGVLICLSTVFVKQHYVPDIAAGIIVAVVFSFTPVLNLVRKRTKEKNVLNRLYRFLRLI